MSFINVLQSIFGNKSGRDMKLIQPIVEKVKAAYPEIQALDNDALRAKTKEIQRYVQDSAKEQKQKVVDLKATIEETPIDERETIFNQVDKIEKEILEIYERALDEVLPVAFSIVKETARRFAENEEVVVTANDFDRELAATKDFVRIEGDKAIYQNHWMAGGNDLKWDMVHYDVQLFGGAVLHQGKIAEMATGEGKTLVATLPVFLNALTGNGVHVVTVNDYLAKRDAEWMGPLYMFNGLSVDCIDKHRPNSAERRKAYQADITFGTNNEFGFDYLRDNMAISPNDLVQRAHNYAIVDEVDSVLIDDARTPLIISGPVERGDDQMFEEFQPLVEKLVGVQRRLATDYLAEARQKINEGREKNDQKMVTEGFLSLFRSHKALPKNKALIKYLSEDGIKSGLLKTEEEYMQNNNRRMPEAVAPLYFVVEEKLKEFGPDENGNVPKYGPHIVWDIMPSYLAKHRELLDPEDWRTSEIAKLGDICRICEVPSLEKYGIDKTEFLSQIDKMADDALASGSPANTIKSMSYFFSRGSIILGSFSSALGVTAVGTFKRSARTNA